MEIVTDQDPVYRSAVYLGNLLKQAQVNGQPVLFLSSGGSALKILEQLDWPVGLNGAIGVIDERAVRGEGNNFLALSRTDFFQQAERDGVEMIDSRLRPGETPNELADRFEQQLRHWFELHQQPEVIATLGIGADGHTAGLFSWPPEDYQRLYCNEDWVVAFELESGNDYLSRVATTETFLREQITQPVAFAQRSGKEQALQQMLESGPVVELPARLIKELDNSVLFTDLSLAG